MATTITTLVGGDGITSANSMVKINDNFSSLNTNKIETDVLDTDTSLAANSDSKIATQKAVKAFVEAGGNSNASETARGIVEEATDAEVTAGTATGATGAKLFITPAKLATRLPSVTPFIVQDIALSTGTGTVANTLFGSASDLTGTVLFVGYVLSSSTTTLDIRRYLKDTVTGNYYCTHTAQLAISASEWAGGMVVVGNYLYVFANSTTICRRYDKADLANVTSITGAVNGDIDPMWSDGTYIYASQGASSFEQYSISGTTITALGNIAFTSAGGVLACTSNGTHAWISDSNGTGTYSIRKYLVAGGAVVSTTTLLPEVDAYPNATTNDPFLFMGSSAVLGIGWGYNLHSNSAVQGLFAHLMGITLP